MIFNHLSAYAEEWVAGLLVVLIAGPIASYLLGPWVFRRSEILDSFDAESVRQYFDLFHPTAVDRNFEKFYEKRFGRRWYVVPTLVLLALTATAGLWVTRSALVLVHLQAATAGTLPATATLALAGAYMWVLGDLTARWRFRDLSPADLWWDCWRLVVAIPIGYAVGALFAASVGPSIAFLLGAFPTNQLFTILRRLGRRQLDLGADTNESGESQLERLQGIDTRIAERFADEGFTTIVQLAYADPVELTMRCSSFAFSFVVDCQSQALAWIYFGDKLNTLSVLSLRGAQEIAGLVNEFDDPEAKATATLTLGAAANKLEVDAPAFERTLREIAEDPYTQFLRAVW
jgi:hypothetical protein